MQESGVIIASSSDWQCCLTQFKQLLKIVQLSLNVLFSGMFIMLNVADFGVKLVWQSSSRAREDMPLQARLKVICELALIYTINAVPFEVWEEGVKPNVLSTQTYLSFQGHLVKRPAQT